MNHKERVELIGQAAVNEGTLLAIAYQSEDARTAVARGVRTHAAESAHRLLTSRVRRFTQSHRGWVRAWVAIERAFWLQGRKDSLDELMEAGFRVALEKLDNGKQGYLERLAVELTAHGGLTLEKALITIAEDMLQEAGL